MRQPYKRKSICHAEPKENPSSCPAYNPFAYLRASVRPSLRPSASLPLRPQLPAGHRANSAIFFLCAPLSYKKMLQCAANVCLYNGSVHKKGARSKNYKTRSRGKGECTTTAAVATTRAEIALTLQAARSTREKIEKHSQHTKHFLHTDTNRLCVRECVCGLVYFFVYIFDCFARAFAISFAATLASAAAL